MGSPYVCVGDGVFSWCIQICLFRLCVVKNIDGLVQDCSNSITNALDLLQSCSELLICSAEAGISMFASTHVQYYM